MKNIIILHHNGNIIERVFWGDLPGEWSVPNYFETDTFNKENEQNITSTTGRKKFYLQAKIIKGHLWWKKTYGHYTQKMESRNIGELLDLWEKNRKAK